MRIGAQRALGAVVAGGLFDDGVDGEILVERDAADVVGRVLGGLELIVGGLEGGGHAAVLNRIRIAHVVDKATDGMRREQKPEVRAMLPHISKKMPRYLPILRRQLAPGDVLREVSWRPLPVELGGRDGRLVELILDDAPSRRRSTRLAMRAMAALWVTMMMVQP